MRAERTNWSSSTTSTRAMGQHRTPFGGQPGRLSTRITSRQAGTSRAPVRHYGPMHRGLIHAAAWSLATGAAVTLSWWGVHTVLAGTAYDPPRAVPIPSA